MCKESLAGIRAEQLAALGCVHLSTARRWKRTGKCPRWLERLVRVCHRGELDDIHRAWRGWRLERGELISPEGWQFSPGAVRSIPLLQTQVKTYQLERRFFQQADWIERRYVVGARAAAAAEPEDAAAAGGGTR